MRLYDLLLLMMVRCDQLQWCICNAGMCRLCIGSLLVRWRAQRRLWWRILST